MFIKRVLLTSVLGMVMTIVGAVAVTPTALDKRTPSSKAYVDTEVETKQIKIPAAGQPNVDAGETVITYTANGNGEIGERALYSDASVYNATTDADKLITASALNDTFTNLPTTNTTKLECANPGTCNLWTIVDQTAYGKLLPVGYTQLEYIESTGTQYIDTGIIPTNTTGLKIKFNRSSASDQVVIGYVGSNGFMVNCATTALYVPFGENYNYGHLGLCNDNTDYVISMNYMNDRKRYVNGVDVKDITETLTQQDMTIPIFAGRSSVSGSCSWYFIGKIYYAMITDGNVLTRNFIPAQRDSDNKPGLYDIVTGTFFTNAATSGPDFTAGPVVQ